MKASIQTIIDGHEDRISAFGVEAPSERIVVNKLIDELLVELRVDRKGTSELTQWEWDALKYLATEYQECEATITASIGFFLREVGLLKE